MTKHELAAENLHYAWDNSLTPRLEIEPGDTVIFETRDAGDNQVKPDSTLADYEARVFKGHPLTGPVFVKGAKPGDILDIEIIEVATGDYGWTGFRHKAGLLGEDFPYAYFHIWNLSEKIKQNGWVEFKPGIRVPLEPFFGVMGVAWNEAGAHSTAPPRASGGNMDIKQLRQGSRLQIPVFVEGGLFSIGDCHAAQGDGEVCITAIETNGRANLRFNLIKDKPLKEPRFWIPQQASSKGGEKGYFATTAHHPDLYFAGQQAMRYMIEYLVDEHKLTPDEAYILCSVVVDLKISQIVDAPNWTVSAFLPNAIFGG
jgi:acetamidase/formamidase